MTDCSGDPGTTDSVAVLPAFPGERPLQHTGTAWKEIAESRLGAKHLLVVARGGIPPAAARIIDEPLLPALPPGHRDAERRLETNTRTHTRNKQNAITRWFIIMNAWTMLYNAIAQCCEKTAPILFRTIFDSCNLEKTRGIVGGFFDGPRAWAIVLVWLSGGRRTKSDKDYYRLAEKLQREHDLPDGCLESEYSKKALAWIIQIAPNHPLKYEAIDSGEWLIDMMPQSLGADKRRLKDMLTKDGRITNLREVMRLCSAIVFDAQSPAATPTCFSLPALDVQPFNVLDLSETCGMALSIDIERPGAFAAATASAGDCANGALVAPT